MKLTKEQLRHYIKQIKIHEKLKISTNERNTYWKQYFKSQNSGRTETSFNMNRF